jgi:cold shock CspA family protein
MSNTLDTLINALRAKGADIDTIKSVQSGKWPLSTITELEISDLMHHLKLRIGQTILVQAVAKILVSTESHHPKKSEEESPQPSLPQEPPYGYGPSASDPRTTTLVEELLPGLMENAKKIDRSKSPIPKQEGIVLEWNSKNGTGTLQSVTGETYPTKATCLMRNATHLHEGSRIEFHAYLDPRSTGITLDNGDIRYVAVSVEGDALRYNNTQEDSNYWGSDSSWSYQWEGRSKGGKGNKGDSNSWSPQWEARAKAAERKTSHGRRAMAKAARAAKQDMTTNVTAAEAVNKNATLQLLK